VSTYFETYAIEVPDVIKVVSPRVMLDVEWPQTYNILSCNTSAVPDSAYDVIELKSIYWIEFPA
jgi:hypothetical protein